VVLEVNQVGCTHTGRCNLFVVFISKRVLRRGYKDSGSSQTYCPMFHDQRLQKSALRDAGRDLPSGHVKGTVNATGYVEYVNVEQFFFLSALGRGWGSLTIAKTGV
jgi:hypothetical protein